MKGYDMNEPRKAFRVFVVDDNDLIATTFVSILKRSGIDARSFTDPRQVLQAARTEAPDLLISDEFMPLRSGVELAIQVQELYPNCKVLLFSGNAEAARWLESARAKGHHFELLMKPIHPADLVKKVQDLMT
jgi:DNA-binding NtrC family response regulator